ncbi:MAG: NAD(P)H-hydrate dehydratase [Saprospiraceae bacterium]|nr:NAD(P)H-hydrate dehydratase [Saprospiraceae bacterium]
MKIFSAAQIRQWDQFTIQNEPISSYDLMERASTKFVEWFISKYPNTDQDISIFCGSGNNGGDGFAVARLLHQAFYRITVFQCKIGKATEDCEKNYQQLKSLQAVELLSIQKDAPLPELSSSDLVIDALFGSGLNRPIKGYWAKLVEHINQSSRKIVAIDIPSGLYSDQSSLNQVTIKAKATLSFERPKLAFFFPQNYAAIGEWDHTSISLHSIFDQQTDSQYHLITEELIGTKLKSRKKFDHKGTHGHALLVVGSYGKIGAGVLAAKACLRTGVGLLTINVPKCGYSILQGQVPEAMVIADPEEEFWSKAPGIDGYKAVGIGCGLGQASSSAEALRQLLGSATRPLVLDADALNIISQNPSWLDEIPKNSILTPHPKEFQRLFGAIKDDFARLDLLRTKAREYQFIILLKGAHTVVALPDGHCYFNNTGNPGMATGGSGDVLTGIITSLLAQGYAPADATVVGVFLHGSAGDLAAQDISENALLPSDLINYIGKVFLSLKK